MYGVKITRRNGTSMPQYIGSLLGFAHQGDWCKLEPFTALTIADAERKAAEMQASADTHSQDYRYTACLLPAIINAPDIKPGTVVSLTACNGTWTVIGVRNMDEIKVQPESLDEDPIWIGLHEITSL